MKPEEVRREYRQMLEDLKEDRVPGDAILSEMGGWGTYAREQFDAMTQYASPKLLKQIASELVNYFDLVLAANEMRQKPGSVDSHTQLNKARQLSKMGEFNVGEVAGSQYIAAIEVMELVRSLVDITFPR